LFIQSTKRPFFMLIGSVQQMFYLHVFATNPVRFVPV
jgi:hypothetical protein